MGILEEIITGCVNNDKKYQDKLFKYFYKKMFIVCVNYMKDEDIANDVVQEGFIKIFNSIIEASQELNVSRTSINCAVAGYTKTAHGFKWKYA